MTCCKGNYKDWPEKEFTEVSDTFNADRKYLLAEHESHIGSIRFTMREVCRRCDNGHQTAIVTTCRELPVEAVASMFARWK